MKCLFFVLVPAALILMPTGFKQGQLNKQSQADTEPAAYNSRCFVCHINCMREDIAVTHAPHDMGCADCHRESGERIEDESWPSGGNGTAPDKIYTRDKINSF